MLTKLIIRNFKRFKDAEIDLGNRVVLVGPNNSGKTSAMQALALWHMGIRRWHEKYQGKRVPKKRTAATINRLHLLAIPHPESRLFWHRLQTHNASRDNGKTTTRPVYMHVLVHGYTNGHCWECGLEFYYANKESIYCRPLGAARAPTPASVFIPEEAVAVNVVFLPPMSGLATMETRLDPGAVNRLIGEGRTADVLRNLCWKVAEDEPKRWEALTEKIEALFGAELDKPVYISERGEITMRYREHGSWLDLTSSGRGLQQTLLLLAYMYANPNTLIMLDEPDAHLEILRQREIYSLIDEVASASSNQIIMASHSEVLLNEAAEKDTVIAFVGQPHSIGRNSDQILKSLKYIPWQDYYQAEQTGWILYLEGSTDLAILKAFARKLKHPAEKSLERVFVRYVGNQPKEAKKHFFGLREAVPDLRGLALFDRLDKKAPDNPILQCLIWKQREIENYLCKPAALLGYARRLSPNQDMFDQAEADRRLAAMKHAIEEISKSHETLGKDKPWGPDIKASKDFLKPVFKKYSEQLSLPKIMRKTSFHQLAEYLRPEDDIDPEVVEKLDAIAAIADLARPADSP